MRRTCKQSNEHLDEKQLYQILENTMNHFPECDESVIQIEIMNVCRKLCEYHVGLLDLV